MVLMATRMECEMISKSIRMLISSTSNLNSILKVEKTGSSKEGVGFVITCRSTSYHSLPCIIMKH